MIYNTKSDGLNVLVFCASIVSSHGLYGLLTVSKFEQYSININKDDNLDNFV
jgi:hypothetical protein